MTSNSGTLLKLYILHVFNDGFAVSFGLLLPFIVADLGLGLSEAGFLGGALNSLGIFLAMPAGLLAVRFGGLRVLLYAVLIYAAGLLLTAASPNFLVITMAFLLGGIGFGVFHPIGFALVARLAEPSQRGKKMADFTAVGDIGRIGIATFVTLLATTFGWRPTALAYGAICVAIFIILKLLQSKDAKVQTEASKADKDAKNISLMELLRDRGFALTTLATIFDAAISSPLFIFLPFLLLAKGSDPALLGGLTGAFFVGNILGKFFLGRFEDKIGSILTFIATETLMAVFIVLLVAADSLLLIILISLILGVLTKGTMPVLKALLADVIDKHGDYERAFAVNTVLASLAITLGSIFLGIISDRFGINTAFLVMAGIALAATIPVYLLKLTGEADGKAA